MKNFESKLAKLVHDYSIKGKVADENFAYKVLELCLENYNISDYVKEFKLNKKDIPLKYQGGYNISGKLLVVDIEELVNKTLEELFLDRINGIETTPYLNLVKINTTIVNVIVHEINHACQYKKCLEGKEDIEKNLLELSFQKNLSIIRNEEISSQKAGYYTLLDMELDREICYIALPSERMANITGLTTVHNICKDLPEKYKGNIDLYNEYILSCAKICAYREYSPTTFITYVNTQAKNIDMMLAKTQETDQAGSVE